MIHGNEVLYKKHYNNSFWNNISCSSIEYNGKIINLPEHLQISLNKFKSLSKLDQLKWENQVAKLVSNN